MAAVPYNTGGMSKATSTIKGEACRFFHGIFKALRKPEQDSLRVRESTDQAPLRVREGKDTTPPSASTRGWSNENEKDYFIMTQNVFVMSQHRDGTNILGPFSAGTLLYMLEGGQIDRNTSLIMAWLYRSAIVQTVVQTAKRLYRSQPVIWTSCSSPIQ